APGGAPNGEGLEVAVPNAEVGAAATPAPANTPVPDAAEEAVIPRAYNFEDRYRAIGEESPFMLDATPEQVIVESPFRDLAVSSVYEGPKGIRVKLVNVKTKTTFYVANYELQFPNENPMGITVVSLENNRDPRKVRVTIEANGEQGTVTVDESLIGVAPTGVTPQAPTQNRGIPNAPVNQQNRTTPQSVTPRSDGTPSGRRRIVLPRPVPRPAAAPAPATGQPQGGAQGAGVERVQQVLQQPLAPQAPAANPPRR
ncbi:MAG: hypothetical protein AAF591_20295, partial [Verrucomicrobiota bacterium]